MEQVISNCSIMERGEMSKECPQYIHFCLRNGARITAFKVNRLDVPHNINQYIEQLLSIYPYGAEIYPITKEEYDEIRRCGCTMRRIVNKARKNNTYMTLNGVVDGTIRPFIDQMETMYKTTEEDE